MVATSPAVLNEVTDTLDESKTVTDPSHLS